MRTTLRDRLDEATAAFWADAELNRYLNEGAIQVARRSESLRSTASINIVAGTADYTAPTNIIRNYRAEYARSSNEIWPLEPRDLNSMDPLWVPYRTNQSRPAVYTMWGVSGAMTISLWPVPNESITGGLKLYYYKLPTAMATDGASLDLPNGWDELPVLYAEYVALRKDKQPNWQEAKGEFEQKMQEMMTLTMRFTDQVSSYMSESAYSGLPAWLTDMG